ncbi:MAG TPA: glutathione S-transferase N-terminal domain-containing protein [Salinisphaeraceae bacterium]|nr:glutathione S-transferase N-terminal domain-containing protein [Salinisphaeraceae bacterium]
MAAVHNSRSLTLFARPDCLQAHRVRLVLAEKGVAGYKIVEVRDENEDLAAVNPYNTLPTLADRELVLYDPRAIIEYLDERYPHPPLMPIDPVQRAQYRMAIYRFELDLYKPSLSMGGAPSTVRKARALMRDALVRLAGSLTSRPTLGDEYSLLDCTLAPVLWRMDYYRLRLPERQNSALREYAEHLFQREAFAASLSAFEASMR